MDEQPNRCPINHQSQSRQKSTLLDPVQPVDIHKQQVAEVLNAGTNQQQKRQFKDSNKAITTAANKLHDPSHYSSTPLFAAAGDITTDDFSVDPSFDAAVEVIIAAPLPGPAPRAGGIGTTTTTATTNSTTDNTHAPPSGSPMVPDGPAAPQLTTTPTSTVLTLTHCTGSITEAASSLSAEVEVAATETGSVKQASDSLAFPTIIARMATSLPLAAMIPEPNPPNSAPIAVADQGRATSASASPGTKPPANAIASTSWSTMFVVRKGIGLKSPAIFFSWNDAKPYVLQPARSDDVEELANNVVSLSSSTTPEFKECTNMQEVVEYLESRVKISTGGGVTDDSTKKKRKASSAFLPPTTTVLAAVTKKRMKKTLSCSYVPMIKQSEFNKMMVQLHDFKDRYQHVNVPGPYSKKVPVDEKYEPLRNWMGMIRQAVKQYKDDPRYCPLTDKQLEQLVDIGFVPRSTLAITTANDAKTASTVAGRGACTVSESNRWKTPTSAHNLLKLKKELEDAWDDRVALLREYRQEKGHANVPRRVIKSLEEKFIPLCKFSGWMRKFLEEYHDSPDKTHFFLTPERVRDLQDIGFRCTSPGKRINARDVDEVSFEDMLAEMKRIKDLNAPIKTNRKLEWWITEQRKQYAAFKASKPSTITPERIALMAEAGFPFEKAKSPSWDERAVDWLEFKTKTGRDPMREESLYQWVYKQRVKYKQRQEGKQNNLTDEQIQRLTEWGFNWEMRFQFPNMAKPVPWEERFEQLVKFKEEHGSCQVQKTVPVLGQWVKQQRKEYRYFVQGSKPSRMTQERIAKLSSIGFDFGEKRWNTGKMKTAHAAIEKGKQQEPQPHMLEDGLLVSGHRASSDEEDDDNPEDHLNVVLNQGGGFRHLQQALAPWDRYHVFNV